MKNFKPNFTITQIGSFRFYGGILLGIGYSFLFYKILKFTTRFCNIGIYINDENWTNFNNYKFNDYYSFLIGFTSISFAFCFTTYMWLSNPFIKKYRNRGVRYAQSNAMFVLFGVLIFLTRMTTFFIGLDITLENDFKITSYLLPTFMYMYCWNLISKTYKSKK